MLWYLWFIRYSIYHIWSIEAHVLANENLAKPERNSFIWMITFLMDWLWRQLFPSLSSDVRHRHAKGYPECCYPMLYTKYVSHCHSVGFVPSAVHVFLHIHYRWWSLLIWQSAVVFDSRTSVCRRLARIVTRLAHQDTADSDTYIKVSLVRDDMAGMKLVAWSRTIQSISYTWKQNMLDISCTWSSLVKALDISYFFFLWKT